MTTDELKKWFIDKYNSCYAVTHNDYPDRIYLFYDESVVRKIKICKLNNTECNIDKVTGEFLFTQDIKNGHLYCDYTEIWKIFENNYSDKYYDIQSFIKSILEEQYKLKVLTLNHIKPCRSCKLEEQHKLKVLIPLSDWLIFPYGLEEKYKLKVLTPYDSFFNDFFVLKEQHKLKVLMHK